MEDAEPQAATAAAAAAGAPALTAEPAAVQPSAGAVADAAAASPDELQTAAAAEAAAQQQQQPQELQPLPQQPTGPTLVKQELTTLQCYGMKPPKWLLPQRVRPPPPKPLCAITGVPAQYRDPLTGHYYASADAFRELRRRLGQPLPDAHKRRRSAAADGAADALGLDGAAAAAAGGGGAAGALGGFPPAQEKLLALLQQQVQQHQAAAASKGRSKGAYQQPAVPDEVASLVLNVSRMVHSGS